jgi:GTP pyrophosphokinase
MTLIACAYCNGVVDLTQWRLNGILIESMDDLLEQAKPHYKSNDVQRLREAIEFATRYHEGQQRDSGEPYIIHPLAVAGIVIDWQMDIDSVIAAVLHDVVEDTEVSLDTVEQTFGKGVAFLVDGVSKVSQARSGMGDITTYLPQTRDNLSKFLIAISHDIRVLLIKLADRLHNLRTLEYISPARQQKVAQESIEVFAPLADRLGMGRVKIEIEEISFSYLHPQEYHQLHQLLKKRLGRANSALEKARRDVATHLQSEGITFTIDGRIKSIYSLHKKLRRVDGDINEVYDLMALRVIVDTKAECYRVLGVIHALYQPVIRKIKDYISVPKPNGYQSLHTTVITPAEQIIEFQIRTRQMHEFAERGLAASFHYNEQKLTKNYLRKRAVELPRTMQWIVELQELATKIQAGETVSNELNLELFSDRIFVHSPKGDIYDLPEGATVLDFAYAVHSDVGSHAQGAKINNKIAKLSTELNNGDIVEVITKKSSHPNSGWLEHVKTSKARQRIKAALRDQ